MTLFRYSPPASEQVGVNYAFGVQVWNCACCLLVYAPAQCRRFSWTCRNLHISGSETHQCVYWNSGWTL